MRAGSIDNVAIIVTLSVADIASTAAAIVKRADGTRPESKLAQIREAFSR